MASCRSSLRAAICSAGVATPGRIPGKKGRLPAVDLARVVQVNLVGTFTVLSVEAEAMAADEPVEDERGVMVCAASIAAYDGQVGQADYAASEGGIAALTLFAARALAEHAIRVVTVAPGLFDTPLTAALLETARVSLAQAVPCPPRLGDTEFASLVRHILGIRRCRRSVGLSPQPRREAVS